MPLKYACFISYKHGHYPLAQRFIDDLETALGSELELLQKFPIYIDKGRLKGGNFFNKALAKAMCQSACMIMVYTPRYFDVDETYCAREYRGMVTLEQQRLGGGGVSPENGLIIPVIFRGPESLPDEIRHGRQCEDFSDFLMVSEEMINHELYAPRIRAIAAYISDRCRELTATQVAFDCCDEFQFPSDDEIRDWLITVVPPTAKFPGN